MSIKDISSGMLGVLLYMNKSMLFSICTYKYLFTISCQLLVRGLPNEDLLNFFCLHVLSRYVVFSTGNRLCICCGDLNDIEQYSGYLNCIMK